MIVRPVDPGELKRLEGVLARYPYRDYRHYPRFSPAAQARVLFHEIERASRRGTVVAARQDGEPAGVGFVEALPWDSDFFGLPMGRLGPLVVAEGAEERPAIDCLLDGLLAAARAAGVRHLSAKVDCGQLVAAQALEVRGFRVVDCLVTYLYDCRRDPIPAIRRLSAVREYRAADRDAVLAVAERAFADYAGRFTVDPWVARDAARRFYVEWVKNACAGRMADRVLVSERAGRIVGFLTYRSVPSVLESTGIRIAGQGISGVLPEGAGAYPALLTTAIVEGRDKYDFAEFDTPIQHPLTQRIFQKMGLRLARSKYVLHRCEPGETGVEAS